MSKPLLLTLDNSLHYTVDYLLVFVSSRLAGNWSDSKTYTTMNITTVIRKEDYKDEKMTEMTVELCVHAF